MDNFYAIYWEDFQSLQKFQNMYTLTKKVNKFRVKQEIPLTGENN